MKWISVKDKLPDTSCEVLVFSFTEGGRRVVSFKIEKDGEGYFSDHKYYLCNVTHWMPLPLEPEEFNSLEHYITGEEDSFNLPNSSPLLRQEKVGDPERLICYFEDGSIWTLMYEETKKRFYWVKGIDNK